MVLIPPMVGLHSEQYLNVVSVPSLIVLQRILPFVTLPFPFRDLLSVRTIQLMLVLPMGVVRMPMKMTMAMVDKSWWWPYYYPPEYLERSAIAW